MPSSHQRPGGEQQVEALGDDELAHEDDGRVAVGFGAEELDVDPRGAEAGLLSKSGDVRERRPEGLGGVAGADEDAGGGAHALFGEGPEAVEVGFDRVLEGRTVDLGGEGPDVGAGEDRRAHDQVIGQGHVDPPGPLGNRPDGGDVGVEVAIELRLAQLREGLDLEPLIGVLHVDGKQPADVGVVDLDPLDPHLAVLAEQVHLVAEPGQRPRQAGVVDVAAGSPQHVAVKDQDAHRFRPS